MIRLAKISDAPAIARIYNYYVKETTVTFEYAPLTNNEMADRINSISASYPYFVYEENDCILGYCYAHPWKERAAYAQTYEISIYLAKEATGQGIGSKLLKRLVDECRKINCHALIACITAENAGSIRFHLRHGFKQVSSFKEVGFKFNRYLDVNDYELLI